MRLLVMGGAWSLLSLHSSLLCAQTPQQPLVRPPPVTVEAQSLLSQDKLSEERLGKLLAMASEEPPAHLNTSDLAHFYFERANSRGTLGRYKESVEDGHRAIDLAATSNSSLLIRYRTFTAFQHHQLGETREGIEQLRLAERDANTSGGKGALFLVYQFLVNLLVVHGDLDAAKNVTEQAQSLFREARNWPMFPQFKTEWEWQVEDARGRLFRSRGQYKEAETAFNTAIEALEQWIPNSSGAPNAMTKDRLLQLVDGMIGVRALVKSAQGRASEAESDIRQALIRQSNESGRYNLGTARLAIWLGELTMHQGRYDEAIQVFRASQDTLRKMGVPSGSGTTAGLLRSLAAALNLTRRFKEANKVFAELEESTAHWDQAQKDAYGIATAQINAYYNTSNMAAAVPAAGRLVQRQIARLGEGHIETALARSLYAVCLFRDGKHEEARREYAIAMPILTASIRESDQEEASETAGRDLRIRIAAEGYLNLLALSNDQESARIGFQLADQLRGQAVQRALSASGARARISNPEVATLLRRQQDLAKEAAAQLGVLNNALSRPPHERDETALQTLRTNIASLVRARNEIRAALSNHGPRISHLVSPEPASASDVQEHLRTGETFISIYLGRAASFVWAVPKEGPIGFARIRAGANDIASKVAAVRKAFEASAVSILDIPGFDVAAAHALYRDILGPVAPTWKQSKSLIVATNGTLGLLPFALLPTEEAEAQDGEGPFFSGYRKVKWLARTHAITNVPSATAFRSLRQYVPATPPKDKFIGFGDPIFRRDQDSGALTTALETTSRGLPLKRRAALSTRNAQGADLSSLPPLPDTATELRAIARALEVDPDKVLHLGADANESTLRTSDLTSFRIVAFATHGLVPGDLEGLTQPALALSAAPGMAKGEGDGLLTAEKILGLRMNADWVLLSACNSGAASAAGEEAASGLGRAFFYAGARALLITNWSVDSTSAQELVSDVFLRIQADPRLDRGEALRLASMRLVDEGGPKNSEGKLSYSYAHPLFWAPYTILGEGSH